MSSDPSTFPELVSSPERRRSPRRKAKLRALLALGPQIHRVDLLDFSERGLKATFVSAPPPSETLEQWLGQGAQLTTTSALSGFALPALSIRVARVGKNDLGLEADSVPPSWQTALSATAPARADVPAPGEDRERMLKRCASVYTTFARRLATDVLTKALEQIAAREGADPFHAQRAGFTDAGPVLTAQRSAIVERFVESAQRRAMTPPSAVESAPPKVDSGALRLMNSDELEDHLTLNGVVSRLEKAFAVETDAFEVRYARLVGVPVNSRNNPFAIEVTLRSLREALHADNFKAPVWRLIYEVLEANARTRFQELLRDLSQIVARVEPVARAALDPARGEAKAAEAYSSKSAKADAPSPGTVDARLARMEAVAARLLADRVQGNPGPLGTATSAYGPAGSGASTDGGGPSAADARAAPTWGRSGGSTAAPSDCVTGKPGAGSAARDPDHAVPGVSGPSTSRVASGPGAATRGTTVRSPLMVGGPARRLNVIAELADLGGHGGTADGVSDLIGTGRLLPELQGAQQEADLDELLAAIDRLPLSSGPAFSEAGLHEVAAQFIEHGPNGPTPQRRISEVHQRVLYTAVQLFQQASREFTPNSLIETLVKRLERTLLKLSLRDGEFPSSPEHPARKVIDLIDQYSLATDDQGRFTDPKLARQLEDLVDRICTQADRDDRVFSVVQASLEQDLAGLRAERQQKVERVREALESRESVRTAREAADTALEQALSERRVPRLLMRLIADCWRQHLVFMHLRHGGDSREWQASLRALHAALTLTQEDVDSASTFELREQIARYIESMLQEHPIEADERRSWLDQLDALLIQRDERLLGDRIQAPRFDGVTNATKSSLAMRPHVGEWWEIQMDGRWVPVQLVWAAAKSDYCGLVNRSANNRLELTYTELRKRLENGQARTRAPLDAPLLNRSEDILLADALSQALDVASRDERTGLMGRKAFHDRLVELEQTASAGSTLTLALFEFDQFRLVASTSGVDVLESLVGALARALVAAAPRDAVVATFRDDTFSMLLQDYSEEAARRTTEEILFAVSDFAFEHNQHAYRIGVCAGLGTFKAGELSGVEMLRRVDAACMAAKSSGRNTLRVYEPTAADLKHEELLLDWAGRIDSVLASEELHLRCQLVAPIGAATKLKPYYELLLGIEAIGGQRVSPFEFVTAMERLGRAYEIDLWVLRQAFDWIRENRSVFTEVAGLAINLSASSLGRVEITDYIRDQFAHGSVSAQNVIFEITESAAIRNFDTAQAFIRELRRFGARVSLDDFGSGFTSYAHLKRLSVDTLKIDGSYVKDLLTSDSDLAIVKSMTDIAHTLGMTVVAEWVETPEILARLLDLGVDYAQGYAVHRPVRLSRLLSAPPV